MCDRALKFRERRLAKRKFDPDQCSRIAGPSRRGWFTVAFHPHELDACALAILTYSESSAPLCLFAIGPAHTVRRSVYFPRAAPQLVLQVFAIKGTVCASIEPAQSLTLAKGILARLARMRDVGLPTMAARVISALQRLKGGGGIGSIPTRTLTPAEWIAAYASPTRATVEALAIKHGETVRNGALAIIDARRKPPADLDRSLTAMNRQEAGSLHLHVLRDRETSSPALPVNAAPPLIVFWLEAGEEPAPHALISLASALEDGVEMAFADHMETRDGVSTSIVCSPGWDHIRLSAGDEIRGLVAFGGALAAECLGTLRHGTVPNRAGFIRERLQTLPVAGIAHIPAPLASIPWRIETAPIRVPQARDRPAATLVVPTHARADLLMRCVESCFDRSSYRSLELVVVDHASAGQAMVQALDSIGRRPRSIVIREEGAYNYSALINKGVAHAKGDIIALLNDDIEAQSADWLENLVDLLSLPETGVAGARLVYPDGRIQHDGVALGMCGLAGNPGRGRKPGVKIPGWSGPWPRTVSAVTGACLVIRRETFEAVGGLDTQLAVEFNDVDLCLRVTERGLRCVLNPTVSLIHHEQATRGGGRVVGADAHRSAERVRFINRWGHILADDPWISPNIALEDESCRLADPPRTRPEPFGRRRILKPFQRHGHAV